MPSRTALTRPQLALVRTQCGLTMIKRSLSRRSQGVKKGLTARIPRALGAIRTRDTRFRRAVLYPLSYEGGT